MEELNGEQRRIVEVLSEGSLTTELLIELTGFTPAKVLSQLTILEIKGIIKRSADKGIYLNNQ